jgi:hypothetical protein
MATRFNPAPVPSPYSASRSRYCRVARSRFSQAVGLRRKLHAAVGFFEDLQETRHRPPLGDLHLEGEHIAGFRLGRQGGELDPALGLWENLDIGIARQGAIQRGEFVAHLLLDLLDKVRSLGGELERRIIGRALDRNVLGNIVIRVPIALGPDHPHFFAAELVAQGL